jgi:hypothetical protein
VAETAFLHCRPRGAALFVPDFVAEHFEECDGSMRVEHDRHLEGLVSGADWLRVLREAGFEAQMHSSPEAGVGAAFVAKKL